MSLKRDCGIASWRGAAIGASATNLRRETESRRRRELTSQQRPTSARWSALQSQLSPRCCPCACTGVRSAYRATQALRDWIRVFVVATVAPSGAEADLHQSSVACGFSWSMCLSNFALGRMPSSIRLFVDVFSFSSAGDVAQPLTAIIIFCRPFVPSSLCGCGGAYDTFACCPSLKVPSFSLSLSLTLTFSLWPPSRNRADTRRMWIDFKPFNISHVLTDVPNGENFNEVLQNTHASQRSIGYGQSRFEHRWPTSRLASHDHERGDTLHRDTR